LEWLYFAKEIATPEVSIRITNKHFNRIKIGDTVYLFSEFKNRATLFGWFFILRISSEKVHNSPAVILSGIYEPHAKIPSDIKPFYGYIRPFDYSSFMRKAETRKTVREIVKGEFLYELSMTLECCKVYSFDEFRKTKGAVQ